MVWLAGAMKSYGQASEVLQRIGHRHIPKSSIWRQVEERGEALKAYVEGQQQHVRPERIQLSAVDHDQRKGISLDGGMVNIRGEGWKEFKAGTVYDIVLKPMRDPLTGEWGERAAAANARHTAVLGGVEPFAQALWAVAVHANVPQAADSCVTADGAAWIWNLANDLFPDSVQIVDWFHACQHLAQASHALHPDNPEAATRCLASFKNHLFLGEVFRIIHTLQQAGLNEFSHYFETHQRRMQYHLFQEDGYPIGSGCVESDIKQFKARLTGPGMRWSRPSAQRMLILRGAVLDGSFDALWSQAA
jgi:hypothetical protein